MYLKTRLFIIIMESESLDVYLTQFQTQHTISITDFNENILNKFISLENNCEVTKNDYLEKLSNKDIELNQHKSEIIRLQNNCDELQCEINTYGKVSIVKNLNKQILDKDLEIKFLSKRVKFLPPHLPSPEQHTTLHQEEHNHLPVDLLTR